VNREIEEEDKKVVSADIARFGDDEIVIDYLLGNRLVEQDVSNKQSLMETVGRIINKRKVFNARMLVVDDAALGGGVTDRLREMDEKVLAVNGGERAGDDDKFANLKSEIWWYAREQFEKGKVSIINDPLLIRQLGIVKHSYRSNGKIIVEPKDEVKTRLGRSPDRADAFTLGLWGARNMRDAAKDFNRARNFYLNNQQIGNPYGWNYHDGTKEEILWR